MAHMWCIKACDEMCESHKNREEKRGKNPRLLIASHWNSQRPQPRPTRLRRAWRGSLDPLRAERPVPSLRCMLRSSWRKKSVLELVNGLNLHFSLNRDALLPVTLRVWRGAFVGAASKKKSRRAERARLVVS